MRLSPCHHLHSLPLALLLVACVAAPVRAQEPDLSAHAAQLKQMQIRFMMRSAQREANEHRMRAKELKEKKKIAAAHARGGPVAGLRRQPESRSEPPDPPGLAPLGVAAHQAPASATAIATDRLVNNRVGDAASSGQCEVSIAANGNNLVAAWNDGQGFVSGGSTQGFAYSSNNGTNWTDGGVPPVTGGVGAWTSDPVIAVNEKTGAFYYAALCEPSGTTNGIGVVKGTFIGGVLTWGTPRVVVSGNYSSVIYDKEWLVADSLGSGKLYLIYSRFTVSGGVITTNRIDFQYTALDNASPWVAAVTLSAAGDAGRVQGSRIAMGPVGEVWATWSSIEPNPPYADHMRIRKITGGGVILGVEITAVSEFTNYGTGAPGFNRGMGFSFPGLAVDRSTGPRRGRVYLAWNESINFFTDPLGGTGTATESEPNDTPATGDPFTQGQTLNGTISSITDLDYWSFSGTQGQTIICEVNASAAPSLDASFRLFCSDGVTRLGFSETGPGGTGLIVFTLPSTGTYTLRVAAFAGSGAYSIITGLNGLVTERARDHRDVFTTYSDVVGTWSTPVRVNGEAALYDDWLPEIAVASNGDAYVAWYDWRDAPAVTCAGSSMVYLSRSTDGGVSWPDGSPVTSALSTWTASSSNIAPNQGDYMSLVANQNAVYPCWSDGRNSDPDIYMAAVILGFTAVQVSLAGTYAEPGLVRVTWYATGANGVVATVYRRTDAEDWLAIGPISPDGTGQMVFEDRNVTAGTRYHYRLGLREGSAESFTDEVTVEVPSPTTLELAIQRVRPNPSDRQMWVSFSLPDAAPASLELIDVSGRRVRERTVTGAGRQMVDLASGSRLTPGIYLLRLSQDRKSVVTRVSVVR